MTSQIIKFDTNKWYSPQLLFDYLIEASKFRKENNKKVPSDLMKLMNELWQSLWFIPAHNIMTNKIWYVQPVSPHERTPDVRIMYGWYNSVLNRPELRYQNIEVVTFLPHEKRTFAEFIIETKFKPIKQYADTVILAIINNNSQVDFLKTHAMIQSKNKTLSGFALMRYKSTQQEHFYKVKQFWPEISPTLEFNATRALKDFLNNYIPPALITKKGTKNVPIEDSGMPVVNPFLKYLI